MKNFFSKHSPSKRKHSTGFTLVELIVSLSLLIVVLFISGSALLNMTIVNKKVQTTRVAMDELNFAIEGMSRQIRTGTAYHCDSGQYYDLLVNEYTTPPPPPQDCSGGDVAITFTSSVGGVIGYTLIGGRINRTLIPPSGGPIGLYGVKGAYGPITSETNILQITNLKFYVMGADNTSGITNQPRVNIVVQGIAGTDPRTQSKFSIYTSITQRATR